MTYQNFSAYNFRIFTNLYSHFYIFCEHFRILEEYFITFAPL